MRGGTAPCQRADQALAAVPRRQWRTLRWRHGTKGWLRKKFVALRAWRLTAQGEAHIGWLLGERAARGQTEERKFYWKSARLGDVGRAGRLCPSSPCH